jgi:hypothetical protein
MTYSESKTTDEIIQKYMATDLNSSNPFKTVAEDSHKNYLLLNDHSLRIKALVYALDLNLIENTPNSKRL